MTTRDGTAGATLTLIQGGADAKRTVGLTHCTPPSGIRKHSHCEYRLPGGRSSASAAWPLVLRPSVRAS